MKKIFALFVFMFVFATNFSAFGKGKVVADSVYSNILGQYKVFSVYLPESYDNASKKFPVLYLLHGAGGKHSDWAEKGKMREVTDRTISAGMCLPMVVVMPDASGRENMGYFNREGWRYEDFFFNEFIPYIEKKYNVLANKGSRAIAGLSMGGGGSLVYAQYHPQMFGSVCALSPRAQGFPAPGKYNEKYVQTLKDNEAVRNVVNADSAKVEQLRNIRWYVDCGDDDYLYEGTINLFLEMKKRNIPLEFRMRDGAHTWLYWQSALPAVLSFVSVGFAQ